MIFAPIIAAEKAFALERKFQGRFGSAVTVLRSDLENSVVGKLARSRGV
jgi:hypothetical protein